MRSFHRNGLSSKSRNGLKIAFARRALRLKGRCAIQGRRNNRRPPPQEGSDVVGCKLTARNTQTARRAQSRPWPDGKCPLTRGRPCVSVRPRRCPLSREASFEAPSAGSRHAGQESAGTSQIRETVGHCGSDNRNGPWGLDRADSRSLSKNSRNSW